MRATKGKLEEEKTNRFNSFSHLFLLQLAVWKSNAEMGKTAEEGWNEGVESQVEEEGKLGGNENKRKGEE